MKTEAKRGPGRPPKTMPEVEGVSVGVVPPSTSDASGIYAAPTTSDNSQRPAAPVASDVAAILASEREKIMAQARREVEAAHAEAAAKTKVEAEKLVKEALAAEAKQRADDAEILRMARASKDLVECRVLPMGDGRIHTGELSEVDSKPLKFSRGDKFWVARSIAVAQEAAGRVEIL